MTDLERGLITDCQWLRLEGDCSYERVRRGILVAMEMLCILTVPVSVSACDIVLMIKCFFFFSWKYFLKLIFNWRKIALQYCAGFCHTTMWMSHKYTYILSLWNFPPIPHPSRWSQSTTMSSPKYGMVHEFAFILVQGSRWSSLYCSNFSIFAAEASTLFTFISNFLQLFQLPNFRVKHSILLYNHVWSL